ncbi:hypothetical protein Q7P35_007506 [Cladosporium inversicolor]
MDPISAISLAAATVQFLQFGLGALAVCKQIRDNVDHATDSNRELEDSIRRLYEIRKILTPAAMPRGASNRHVVEAALECSQLSDELLQILQALKDHSQRRNLAVLRKALQALRSQRKIEKLQNRLVARQARLDTALTVEMRAAVFDILARQEQASMTSRGTLDQMNSLSSDLGTIRLEISTGHADLRAGLAAMEAHTVSHQTITMQSLEDAKIASSSGHQVTHDNLDIFRNEQMLGFEATKSHLRDIATQMSYVEASLPDHHTRALLDSLRYDDMNQRLESIKTPWPGTFDWIFEDDLNTGEPVEELTKSSPICTLAADDTTNSLAGTHDRERFRMRTRHRGLFTKWLISDNPVFWVCGKAGSGKSTLVAHIVDDRRTRLGLMRWANVSQLNILSFFFWRPGSVLQRDVKGLLRSLLFQLLVAKPFLRASLDLDSSIVSAMQINWTPAKLQSAWRLALENIGNDHLCIFIDGLDEFTGDYEDLLDVLLKTSQVRNIKLCLSSRPIASMIRRLSSYPSLSLQQLNEPDIKTYVQGKLQPYGGLQSNFAHTVVERAEGVFLWAALVVTSLISGFIAGDEQQLLQTRLLAVPTELNDLLTQMLASIEKTHMAVFLFYVHTLQRHDGASASLALPTASLLSPKVQSYRDFLVACKNTSQQVVARSKGLIEIRPSTHVSRESIWTREDRLQQKEMEAQERTRARLVFSVAEERQARTVLQQYWSWMTWVHRSAYDIVIRECGRGVGSQITADMAARFDRALLRGHFWLQQYLPFQIKSGVAYPHGSGAVMRFIRRLPAHHAESIYGHLDALHAFARQTYSQDVAHHVLTTEFGLSRSPASETFLDWYPSYTFWQDCARYQLHGYVQSRLPQIENSKRPEIFLSTMLWDFVDNRRLSGDPFYELIHFMKTAMFDILVLRAQDYSTRKRCVGRGSLGQDTSRVLSWTGYGIPHEDVFVANFFLGFEAIVGRRLEDFTARASGIPALTEMMFCDRTFAPTLDQWDVFVDSKATPDVRPFSLHVDAQSAVGHRLILGGSDATRLRLVCLHPKGELQRDSLRLMDPRIDETVVSMFEISTTAIARMRDCGDALCRDCEDYSDDADVLRLYVGCQDILIEDIWDDSSQQLDAWQQVFTLACVRRYLMEWLRDVGRERWMQLIGWEGDSALSDDISEGSASPTASLFVATA